MRESKPKRRRACICMIGLFAGPHLAVLASMNTQRRDLISLRQLPSNKIEHLPRFKVSPVGGSCSSSANPLRRRVHFLTDSPVRLM